ncbi:FecR family protein [Aestuariibaculum suncheonense]|uniref:FecR domain-containing protein n=1 Tax=Aestuariibaculum suncheonense TaxID=1028745 RepID=A0A8J6QPR2_9FLAO|nr:FecR family protein [Aestuariibaculum suncheonense]MBD0834384.1 FecR domain-containing protein [Aestuariibaculum suncheonense]
MDEINKQFEYSELLAGRVLDALTDEQKKFLMEWEQQGNNKELREDILNAYSFRDWQHKLKTIDTVEEWASFLERMDSSSAKTDKVIKLSRMKWVSAVAATLVVGLTVFTLFNKSSNLKPIEDIKIAPGSSHAELVLSNGEVVDLDESENEIVEGVVGAKNTKGILQYKDALGSRAEDRVLNEAKVNTLRVPRGAEYQLVLSDGTKVWLNSDTELTYTVPFVGSERRVALKGEAYFDVTPNKELPFIVTSGTQEVQVLGTEFNVSAYSEETHITTTLVEGKVMVEETYSHNQQILSPNQQANFDTKTKSINKKNVDVYPYVAWKEGRFVFHNVTLEELFSKISKWYNVEYEIEGEKLKALKFTGDLPRYNDMSGILKIIEAEMSVNIQIGLNNKVYVSE